MNWLFLYLHCHKILWWFNSFEIFPAQNMQTILLSNLCIISWETLYKAKESAVYKYLRASIENHLLTLTGTSIQIHVSVQCFKVCCQILFISQDDMTWLRASLASIQSDTHSTNSPTINSSVWTTNGRGNTGKWHYYLAPSPTCAINHLSLEQSPVKSD